ncbi:hypothetical protein D7Y42_09425 [Stenotrophomonas maltophilia]|nr:hypothetical protein CEQ03_14315 [Stenotrophomonas maltophilia]KUJ03971.1 hypothetical protein AR275_32895 [Stenotrophomonas maltophilia]KUO97656.1 hypothetical protein AR274_19865 [Stenotrophomonas maltophilia]MBA0294054.1 hypothetical protein [Stenotrophomonas maltophilia]MBA0350822.1 hypothetical protein [Stenotrophomonas maltophilia]
MAFGFWKLQQLAWKAWSYAYWHRVLRENAASSDIDSRRQYRGGKSGKRNLMPVIRTCKKIMMPQMSGQRV